MERLRYCLIGEQRYISVGSLCDHVEIHQRKVPTPGDFEKPSTENEKEKKMSGY